MERKMKSYCGWCGESLAESLCGGCRLRIECGAPDKYRLEDLEFEPTKLARCILMAKAGEQAEFFNEFAQMFMSCFKLERDVQILAIKQSLKPIAKDILFMLIDEDI